MTIWILIVCLYGGTGTQSGVSCVQMPKAYATREACTRATALSDMRGWRTLCVEQPKG